LPTKLFVQRNPQESDLRSLSDQEMQQLRSTNGFQIGAGLDEAASTSKLQVPKHPLEGWLLAALACVFLAELLLAGWMTQRRNVHLQPVTMEG
jgi:hypothetical protein